MYKLVVDLDGTLITCQSRQLNLLRAVGRRYGHSIDTEALWNLKREGFSTELALKSLGFNRPLVSNIVSTWMDQVEEPYWLAQDQCFLDTKPCLAELLKIGFEITLLTARRCQHNLAIQLRTLGLTNFFVRIVVVQPQNAVQQKARHLSSSKALFYVADAETDFIAAKLASVPCLLLSRGQRSESFLRTSLKAEVLSSFQVATQLIIRSLN